MKQPLICIVGPTAVGKTDIAFQLAQRTKREIISCDSMLVYREPVVITSKPPQAYLSEVPHHLMNLVSVVRNYNAYDFSRAASALLSQEYPRRNFIITGGSGLYLDILLYGIFDEGKGRSRRNEILAEALAQKDPKGYLCSQLAQVDPQSLTEIDTQNIRRLVRALEVFYASGEKFSEKKKKRTGGILDKYPVKIFGLFLERKLLYEKINQRTKNMFQNGAPAEVQELLKLPLSVTARKIIGISEIEGALRGAYSLEHAQELVSKNTRHLAKRQLTWFRRKKDITWLDISQKTQKEVIEFLEQELNTV